MTTDPQTDFDGCNFECRKAGAHTLRWGGCEHAPKPEPTVSMSVVYDAADGHKAIGYDSYTVTELAELIEPALRTIKIRIGPNARGMLERGEEVRLSVGEYASLALAAADAIVHRNDDPAAPPTPVSPPPAADRAGLRERIAAAIWERQNPGRRYADCEYRWRADAEADADAVLSVLPPDGRAAEPEPPLSPDYEHPACGFHWHGRDGMDIPLRDGEPVCPRCELRRVEKLLNHREKRCEELRAESKRRGRNVLEGSEKNRALERQIDETRRQLGAEILRAGQAETELRRLAAGERDEQQAQQGGAETDEWHRVRGFDQHDDYRTAAPATGQPPADTGEEARPAAMTLSTRCDACRHTLNWHRNDVGCTVALCVCGAFREPIEELAQ